MQNSAPVYELTEDQRGRGETAAWVRLGAPSSTGEMFAAWLALLAVRIERARGALVLTREDPTHPFTVAAVWPDARRDLQYLSPVAQRALERREGIVAAPGGEGPPGADGVAHVAYPLDVGGELRGAVVFDIGPGPVGELQAALRQIHWGAAWLSDHFRLQDLLQTRGELLRVSLLGELMATAMQHPQLHASALAVVNELAQRMGCDRVSVGFERSGQVTPLVMSNTATFDRSSDLVRWIGAAMDEVLDLGVAVSHPAPDGEPLAALAHVDSARQLAIQAMLSVPVRSQGQTQGVLTFERNLGPAFSQAERTLAAALGVMLGPFWTQQRANERAAVVRARDGLRDLLLELGGPRHPGLKLAAASAAVLLCVLTLWRVDYRIAAHTAVEGSTQIAAVAPFEGFVAEAFVRAGDTVSQGQPLARLDDRDLKLERLRWGSERDQLERKVQVAQAQGDRAAMGVLTAQVHQAEAQLALAEDRLARATVIAPFSGIVVSGDLSQQIGSPVETGRVLFEVAPLRRFRVMLQVDDRDITEMAVGQPGKLVLSGLPDHQLPIRVERITPVASQKDGRNFFAVEAAVEPGDTQDLRPGMEGIGKVVVGRQSVLWLWTHSLVDWLRLTLWSWSP